MSDKSAVKEDSWLRKAARKETKKRAKLERKQAVQDTIVGIHQELIRIRTALEK